MLLAWLSVAGSLPAENKPPADESAFLSKGVCGYPSTVHIEKKGRYVRIKLPMDGWLHLAEVQVMASPVDSPSQKPVNMALRKPARQSSTSDSGAAVADRAVDGNTDGNYVVGSVSHTNFQSDPWWEVDLGQDAWIHEVRVWNSVDAVPERLKDFVVVVSNEPTAEVPQEVALDQEPEIHYPRHWGYLRIPAYGIFLLALAWLVHVFWWKAALPKDHNRALLLLFGGIGLLGIVLDFLFSHRLRPVKDVMEWVFFLSFYVPVALTYISLYSLIEEQSPSLAAIELLARSGRQGMPEALLRRHMEAMGKGLLERRVELLGHDGLLVNDGQTLALTPKGRFFAALFRMGASWIGLKKGA